MTDVVLVALIAAVPSTLVAAGTLVLSWQNRTHLAKVAENVDGILTAAKAGELKATAELQHALGKEEGTNKERDRA